MRPERPEEPDASSRRCSVKTVRGRGAMSAGGCRKSRDGATNPEWVLHGGLQDERVYGRGTFLGGSEACGEA